MNTAKLVESYKRHPAETEAGLRASLRGGAIRTDDLDLGDLFVECFGWNNFRHCRQNLGDCAERAHGVLRAARVEESAGANSTTAFLNITQQFAYERVLAAYDVPARVFVNAIPTRPSKFKFERIPGVTHVGDESDVVEEGKPYPEVGVGEDWTDTPETRKRGMVARATKEAVFFDQTGEFMTKLDSLGEWQGVSDEKRAITCIVDAGETPKNQYRYRWRNYGPLPTYGDNSGLHSWDNLVASNALVDYTDVQAAWQCLVEMLDPATGEPQNVTVKHICVPPALAFTVPFALKGMVRRTAPGFATSGNPASAEIPNPTGDIVGQIQAMSSQLFRAVSGSDTTWFIGDIGAAFEQIENWPLTVTTMGAGSQLEFDQDIIFQSKVSKRSTFSTVQPRKMVKCTA
ncbi:hypothetical protein GobsT_71400 [Gemmata obscuriglobus]|uniref:Uncharacterized protein n=1 Tax=Gemmata obscuriglobus TaxID=114 RepID=A0A2Z3HDT5_9BACT|nr:hypothetical protein [Gemmata obscuriglobus]AWM41757.1 hypothetical protein C1280_35355 [Gemmata obscuriglobus]QEG32287.1 hypothetical protein GobsT_71400 [Gemmata obscuriglobus]VTS11643.1 Uncharacterized protein OS=Blastopirellula marina DSM 3645 GN=DSM3645_28857 PE=4 SV=1 [Gemmata obscuriglobus UQM 2246]